MTKADNDSIKSFPDLKVKNLHNLQPVTGAKMRVIMVAIIVTVDSLAQNLEAVKQGRVDATVNDKLAVIRLLQKQPNSGLKLL